MDGLKDINHFKETLELFPTVWEGKTCVLELKEANYNWRQMEWWAFYFEYKFKELSSGSIIFPGDKYGTVTFDMKGEMNWDLKAKAIKSDNHSVILNDKLAMEKAMGEHGYHGEVIALCDVEYNDTDRSFQRWHTELKGGFSKYEIRRRKRTSISRYRKTKAELTEVLFVILKESDLKNLSTMKQGINSNDQPRPPKYMLNLEKIDQFHFEKFIV